MKKLLSYNLIRYILLLFILVYILVLVGFSKTLSLNQNIVLSIIPSIFRVIQFLIPSIIVGGITYFLSGDINKSSKNFKIILLIMYLVIFLMIIFGVGHNLKFW